MMKNKLCTILTLVFAGLLLLNFMTTWSAYDSVKKNLSHAQRYQHEKHEYFWKGVLETFRSQSITHEIIWQIRN